MYNMHKYFVRSKLIRSRLCLYPYFPHHSLLFRPKLHTYMPNKYSTVDAKPD